MIPRIYATIVFAQDLDTCTAFYRDTLGMQMTGGDEVSANFQLGDQHFHLLALPAAAELLATTPDALRSDGKSRGLFAARVDDVDATYQALVAKGVTILRPPVDREWGLRTAHFADPEGNIWEILQPIRSAE
jgi:catechol 2,3-dioxygenase-like lactoylglutathione lyase family enzyme